MSKSQINDFYSIAIRPGSIPYFLAMLSDEAMTSKQMLDVVGARFERPHLRINSNGFAYGFWSKSDENKAKKILYSKQQLNNQLGEYTSLIGDDYQKIIDLLDEYYTIEKSLHTSELLITYYQKLCDTYRNLCCYAYVANILNIADDLREELSEYVVGNDKINQYLLELTRNPKANFIYEHDLELINIFETNPSNIQTHLEGHIKKWYSLFCGSISIHSSDSFIGIKKRINMFQQFSSKERLFRKQKYMSTVKKVQASQERLQRNLKLSDATIKKITIMKDSVVLKETRKFCMTRISKDAESFISDLGKYFELSNFFVRSLTPEEYKQGSLMSGEAISETNVQNINKSSFYEIKDGKTERFTGKMIESKMLEYNISLPIPININDNKDNNNMNDKVVYSGFVACLGYYQGPVRLVNTMDDLENFKDGDILVTPLTTPEYAVIFDKIKGMITYDGASLTSHPATLSREYGIPAILGVTDLQHKLRNGDIVEVDANNNQIRIIK